MPKRIEPLSPSAVQNAKPQTEPHKLRDGHGLYLLVEPAGGKLWRFDYRRPSTGKRNTLSLGSYPDVSLKRAREKREEASRLLADGIDPGENRRAQKRVASVRAANSFEAVAEEWVLARSVDWVDEHTAKIRAWLGQHVNPSIGSVPVAELEAPEILEMLRKLVARGTLNTAGRVREMVSAVFRFAIATGRAKHDYAADLRDALPKPTKVNFASLTEPKDVGDLLRAIDGYQGSPITLAALKLAPLLFQRPGELRAAEWTEFDLEKAEWRIPAARQKLKKAAKNNPRTPPHIVPLSTQAVALLGELRALTGRSRYLFPGVRTKRRPMSENTVNAALRRLGYTKEQMTGHGFRHMASTRLNEMGWNPDAVERQLSHRDSNEVRGTYNQAKYLAERTKMMQAWADYLDGLRTGAKVVPIKRRAG
jgi:integrase